jgi:phage protein D
VELDDTDGRWLDAWYPGKGDTLTLKVGYQGEKLLSCGTFSIDEIEVSSPASVVAIRGVATSVNSALRTKSVVVSRAPRWRPSPGGLPKSIS